MGEYFVGADVYERLHWILNNIEKEELRIRTAQLAIQERRRQALSIITERADEDLAIWFAEECHRRNTK